MNGLEYLKSCTSNVRLVDGLVDAQYAYYTTSTSDPADEVLHATITELRQINVLCTAGKGGLWVFDIGNFEGQGLSSRLQGQFTLQQEDSVFVSSDGTVEDEPGPATLLLDAVEGSIASIIANEVGLRHIGPFTWLYERSSGGISGAGNTNMLLRLSPNLNADGTLYISVTSQKTGLQVKRSGNGSQEILLAPSGTIASLVDERNLEDLTTAAPSRIIRGTIWKSGVSLALQAEGIEVSAEDDWATVKIPTVDEHFIWPASLCIATNDIDDGPAHWTSWFSNLGKPEATYKDPLAAAEEWYNAASERNESTRHANAPSAANDVHSAEFMVAETPMATSPPFNQRLVDQQAALSGIYPTPPDGLLPHQPIPHATSDMLGSAMQVDPPSVSNEPELPSSEDNLNRSASMESAREGHTYQPHSDDLFGDMNEIDFTSNEVGEEDFDYFDEPDDVPGGEEAGRDTVMAGTSDLDGSGDLDAALDAQKAITRMALDDTEPTHSSPRPTQDELPESTTPHNRAALHTDDLSNSDQHATALPLPEPEKPLSPFGIKERFLPRPIPASAIPTTEVRRNDRGRSSTFDPMQFNEELGLSEKYTSTLKSGQYVPSISGPDIALPYKARTGQLKSASDPDSGVADLESSSESGSADSPRSLHGEEDLPPAVPWITRKRKRTSYQEHQSSSNIDIEQSWPNVDQAFDDQVDVEGARLTLRSILRPDASDQFHASNLNMFTEDFLPASQIVDPPPLELTTTQLVAVAQLMCEQSASTTPLIPAALNDPKSMSVEDDGNAESALQSMLEGAMKRIFDSVEHCVLPKLALVREPPPRPIPNPGKAPQMGLPRLPHREGSMQPGPDCFNLPPPYVRVQRGSDMWEMLPPAVDFWGALGLGPANSTKDLTAIVVSPSSDDLLGSLKVFIQDLASTYEGSKFGTFQPNPEIDIGDHEGLSYEDGIATFSFPEDDISFPTVIKAYQTGCWKLGNAIGHYSRQQPERTIVVCIVDPFEDSTATKYLCMCFWRLFSGYRQSMPKVQPTSTPSDLVLQIIPISLLASSNGLVLLDNQQMSALAMEIYDRCPPSALSSTTTDGGSALSIITAPAVEIASMPPKRISFQLSPDPPSDLLQEGSVLHLAYTLTADGQWMTTCWTDSTGRYFMPWTVCIRGKSFRTVVGEVWEKTMEIISARTVTWRVFIVSNGNISPGVQMCWRNLVASKIRKQTLHVTFLSVQKDPPVSFTPPPSTSSGQVGSFLTPATTPQPSGMTVSPDASGQTSNPPPTPAPSDGTPSTAENESDAHLIDVSDESWGMLLSPAFTSPGVSLSPASTKAAASSLAKGILLRRGNTGASDPNLPLEALCVSLHWDIRMRPGGNVEEGPVRQAEVTLRDVLRMYRNLALLARLRRLDYTYDGAGRRSTGNLPLHVLCVVRAAAALNGYI